MSNEKEITNSRKLQTETIEKNIGKLLLGTSHTKLQQLSVVRCTLND
jgi:hypothetical protein